MGNENLQNTLENIPTNATNTTANIGLPLFTSDDKPSWLTDWNGAMSKIDENAGVNSESLESLKTATDSMSPKITNLENRVDLIETEQAEHDADISKNTSDLATVKDDLIAQNTLVKQLTGTQIKTIREYANGIEFNWDVSTVASKTVTLPINIARLFEENEVLFLIFSFYRESETLPIATIPVTLEPNASNTYAGIGSMKIDNVHGSVDVSIKPDYTKFTANFRSYGNEITKSSVISMGVFALYI